MTNHVEGYLLADFRAASLGSVCADISELKTSKVLIFRQDFYSQVATS